MEIKGIVSKNGSCVLKVGKKDSVFTLKTKPSPVLYKTKEEIILRPVKDLVIKIDGTYYMINRIEKKIKEGFDASGMSNTDIRMNHGFEYNIILMPFLVEPDLEKYKHVSECKTYLQNKERKNKNK